MTGRVSAAARRLRGVRAQLVIAYVVVASVAGAGGLAIFSHQLGMAVHESVDATLRSTADAYEAAITSGAVPSAPRSPVRVAGGFVQVTEHAPSTVVAVYNPAGRLVGVEPSRLPADPRLLVTGSGYQLVRYNGKPYLFLERSVRARGGRWRLLVGESLLTARDTQSDAQGLLYVLVPIAVLLSGIGAWLLAGAALRPVDRMRGDVQRLVDTGEPGVIRTPDTSDSLDRLAVTFNTLLERLHASVQRQRDLVADAGHELRTPLAVLQTELEVADRPGRTRADLVDSIRHARHETTRLATLSEDLLLLAQADGPARLIRTELTEPAVVVRESLEARAEEFTRAGVSAHLHAPAEPILAEVDPVAVRRIMDNLLANALRHTPGGGAVSVTLRAADDRLVLVVEDTGGGFPPEFLPHAFERFTRADRSRSRSSHAHGSGLGLGIVDTLVRAHGGSVQAANRPDGGARITIVVPNTSSEMTEHLGGQGGS